ncbi:type I polyketide synthase [Babesia caballi]|uniref:Type I polyketide synthase n=1 Tax=Babesia caballi TaxID=5871 RepID=A0AAV4LNK1_BABCB|nr:type I polyketide synthase [Babesia caballi]
MSSGSLPKSGTKRCKRGINRASSPNTTHDQRRRSSDSVAVDGGAESPTARRASRTQGTWSLGKLVERPVVREVGSSRVGRGDGVAQGHHALVEVAYANKVIRHVDLRQPRGAALQKGAAAKGRDTVVHRGHQLGALRQLRLHQRKLARGELRAGGDESGEGLVALQRGGLHGAEAIETRRKPPGQVTHAVVARGTADAHVAQALEKQGDVGNVVAPPTTDALLDLLDEGGAEPVQGGGQGGVLASSPEAQRHLEQQQAVLGVHLAGARRDDGYQLLQQGRRRVPDLGEAHQHLHDVLGQHQMRLGLDGSADLGVEARVGDRGEAADDLGQLQRRELVGQQQGAVAHLLEEGPVGLLQAREGHHGGGHVVRAHLVHVVLQGSGEVLEEVRVLDVGVDVGPGDGGDVAATQDGAAHCSEEHGVADVQAGEGGGEAREVEGALEVRHALLGEPDHAVAQIHADRSLHGQLGYGEEGAGELAGGELRGVLVQRGEQGVEPARLGPEAHQRPEHVGEPLAVQLEQLPFHCGQQAAEGVVAGEGVAGVGGGVPGQAVQRRGRVDCVQLLGLVPDCEQHLRRGLALEYGLLKHDVGRVHVEPRFGLEFGLGGDHGGGRRGVDDVARLAAEDGFHGGALGVV